jgi:mRNA interferase MazF
MTTATRSYPTRVRLRAEGKAGELAVDQIRAADRSRLVRKLG